MPCKEKQIITIVGFILGVYTTLCMEKLLFYPTNIIVEILNIVLGVIIAAIILWFYTSLWYGNYKETIISAILIFFLTFILVLMFHSIFNN